MNAALTFAPEILGAGITTGIKAAKWVSRADKISDAGKAVATVVKNSDELVGVEKVVKSGSKSIYQAPKIKTNFRGEITNGKFILDTEGMIKHTNGTVGKSQFIYDVDANKAVLDAAAYADEYNLWGPSSKNLADFADKAKVYVENGPVGVTGQGELTNYINIYRTKTGYVHGCPGNP